MPLSPFIQQLRAQQNLTSTQTREAFDIIFTGQCPETQIGDFLLGLHQKGESTDEILGAVQSMRTKAVTITAPEDAIDIVGTGGDTRGTLNISTAAALVVAACGVPVAKHGNRASTSKSGSSDVLAALGLNLEPPFAILEQCLSEANLCFLFAPRHHPAMRHVAAIRKKLGVRTLFNLLGPLTNPAQVKLHLIGVYAESYLRPMAEVLRSLDSRAAWLTFGRDGLDEITTTTDSAVVRLHGGIVDDFTLSPVDDGIRLATLSELQGGDAAANAAAILRLLKGESGPYRDIVCVNAAAALVVAGKAADLKIGLSLAAQALDSGTAYNILQSLIRLTNRMGT